AHITNNSANAVRTMIFWGDGTKSENERNLSHTYSDTGLFKVVMVCYSNEGCSDTTRALLRLPASQADVFPNPFRDKLELNFEIAEAGPVNITLYNILGQQVLHVPNSNYNAGRHHIKLDLNNRLLPAGAYTLKLQVNDKPEQIKLIKW
ncbi:MAG: T9SS type A sorting domain-containing protein, partial [Bacteroidia bacterium]